MNRKLEKNKWIVNMKICSISFIKLKLKQQKGTSDTYSWFLTLVTKSPNSIFEKVCQDIIMYKNAHFRDFPGGPVIESAV